MIYTGDKWLEPYKERIDRRKENIDSAIAGISSAGRLADSVNNHLYYGLHRSKDGWVFREWAPNATRIYLIGEFNNWKRVPAYQLSPLGGGDWEIVLDSLFLSHGMLYKLYVEWPGGGGERIPSYAVRCVQDPQTKAFCAQVWAPDEPYEWKNGRVKVVSPLIYEAHVGMSSEEEKVAGFDEFRRNVLPRVCELGYNALQLMALQEHPYYGSFGYQVSNFFALSSRFGTPEEFKRLVDEAHSMGIAVIMDIVHSHSVANSAEGLGLFDGTQSLYFHQGERGRHPAWGSLCFDYGKAPVRHFLLSNCKYWMEEYRLDGFRFDGVTSMLYYDHGLGRDFKGYGDYFNGGTDEDAETYLALANRLVKEINPDSITIAEDVSGMPGLAAPIEDGGIGFDFRMAMGIADHWIKWLKEVPDEEWNIGEIYWVLTDKRSDERTVSYAECHDQALVGDKTIAFRLMDKDMYYGMGQGQGSPVIERGMALHKMIRLATAATAGGGYLNFMGNEFGHPEWIDFPREGNGWSYKFARRQWHLVDDASLKYRFLWNFDRDMVHLLSSRRLLEAGLSLIRSDEQKKVLVFKRGNCIFALNFNVKESFSDYSFAADAGCYSVVLDSDEGIYGGFGRNDGSVKHFTQSRAGTDEISVYLPCRSAIVLERM